MTNRTRLGFGSLVEQSTYAALRRVENLSGFFAFRLQMRHVGGLESDTRLHERATAGSVGLESRARWLKIVWTTRCDGMAPGSIVKRNSFCYG